MRTATFQQDQELRSRRLKNDSQRSKFSSDGTVVDRSLNLQGIVTMLKEDTCNKSVGGINCSICGKLYKSKVCFTKHIWEHSMYWDLFDDMKHQDRVLSIQGALILYSLLHPGDLAGLLVTDPPRLRRRERLEKAGIRTQP
ncbi:hypothetical protein MRX96_032271 [Rhipicephalus microplus]|nr:uncharacterized protein LOC126545430 [Dermacentor andersoni]